MNPLRIALLFFACAGLPLVARAQSGSPATPKMPGTFRLLAVHSGGDGIVNITELKYEISPNRPPEPVSMGGNLSAPYTRPSTPQIVFFEEIASASLSATGASSSTNPVVRRPRLSVSLPDDNLPYLIVVTAAPPDSPLPLVGRAFCSDAKTHPASSLRIINLAPGPAAASIDSQTDEIEAYASQVIPLKPPQTGKTKFLRLKFGLKQNGDWSLIHDESFRYRPEYRMYAIILNARSKDEQRLKIFSERPPAFP